MTSVLEHVPNHLIRASLLLAGVFCLCACPTPQRRATTAPRGVNCASAIAALPPADTASGLFASEEQITVVPTNLDIVLKSPELVPVECVAADEAPCQQTSHGCAYVLPQPLGRTPYTATFTIINPAGVGGWVLGASLDGTCDTIHGVGEIFADSFDSVSVSAASPFDIQLQVGPTPATCETTLRVATDAWVGPNDDGVLSVVLVMASDEVSQ